MSKSFIGTIIQIAIIVVGFLMLPIYYMGVIEMAKAPEVLLNETQLFLDKVSDTKKITKADLEDFTLAMSSTSVPVKFEIFKEIHQVNPDPTSTTDPKATYSTWVPEDDIYNYKSGDIIIIRVDQIGKNLYQSFSIKSLGMYTPEVDFHLSRMVR